MDSFELNKIIGAILGTLLFVMGVGFLAEGIYAPITGQGPGYSLPEPAANATATPAAAAPSVPLPELLAKADPTQGAESAKKCQACHDFTEGGPNKTGPNLYDVVGRKIASHPGYDYSDALKAHANETWTYENLNKWLASPKTFAPGTKMTFVGIPDDQERANVLAYLRSLSHNPVPLPAATAAAPAKAGAAAPTASGTTPASNTQPPVAPSSKPAVTPAPSAGVTQTAPTANTAPAPSAAPAQPAPPNTAPGPATGTTTPGSAQPSAPASTEPAKPSTPTTPAPATTTTAPAATTPAQ